MCQLLCGGLDTAFTLRRHIFVRHDAASDMQQHILVRHDAALALRRHMRARPDAALALRRLLLVRHDAALDERRCTGSTRGRCSLLEHACAKAAAPVGSVGITTAR